MPQQTKRMQDPIRMEMALSPHRLSGNCSPSGLLQAGRHRAIRPRR
jgi:hypothetical protein